MAVLHLQPGTLLLLSTSHPPHPVTLNLLVTLNQTPATLPVTLN